MVKKILSGNPVTNSCQDKKGDLINLDRRLGTLLIQFKLPTKMSTLIILCARLGAKKSMQIQICIFILCTFLHPNLCVSSSNSDNNLKNFDIFLRCNIYLFDILIASDEELELSKLTVYWLLIGPLE